ncbi:MAG: DUF6526 family protein, partial [Gemmatimonadales bacterium]
VPAYHFGTAGILLINLGWAIYSVIHAPTGNTVVALLLAAALILLFYYARTFALRAQDRIIRLEERLRLAALLPPDLQPRIPEFTSGQLIALRFASDAELPRLARRVLDERLTSRSAIKALITEWRADHLRA